MRRACRWFLGVYGLIYLVALLLFVIGTYGLFGSPRGPLAGVFLIPLGLPWNLWLDPFGDALRPWLSALSPAVTLAILFAACRLFGAPRTTPRR